MSWPGERAGASLDFRQYDGLISQVNLVCFDDNAQALIMMTFQQSAKR